MTATGFLAALETTNEIELTTTGRVTGKLASRPVWFVQRGEILYLLPVTGSDSQWYKNVLKTPAIRLAAGRAHYDGTAAPMTDPAEVRRVVDDFRAKYGSRDVAAYYPHTDVAVEVPVQ
jgi:deazaflavin-dependent oxidoreductase (nitroreductase family)